MGKFLKYFATSNHMAGSLEDISLAFLRVWRHLQALHSG